MVDYIIAGGGYRGILASALLSKKGYRVTLIDAAPKLGGVYSGGHWKGFALDLGCHLFGNTNALHTSLLLEILGDLVSPLHVRYAGRTANCWHENFTVPSLVNGPENPSALLYDLIKTRAKPEQTELHSYQHYLVERFGETAARQLIVACRKKVQYDPALLDPVASRVVLFDRVNLFDQATSSYLKQHLELNNLLAASDEGDPMRYYPEAKAVYPHRNFYPKGGTHHFCQRAQEYLEQAGVQILLNTKINRFEQHTVYLDNGEAMSCQKLFWTLELEKAEKLMLGQSELEQFIHPVPMVVVYFEVPYEQISDYTYLHDHSSDTAIFRASTIGKYSQQIIDGYSYICCEIPTSTDSAYWQQPELFVAQFWQEAILLRVVEPGAHYRDVRILKAPVTYKLPKLGFSAKEHLVREQLNKFDGLLLTDTSYFSTQDIAKVIHAELQEL